MVYAATQGQGRVKQATRRSVVLYECSKHGSTERRKLLLEARQKHCGRKKPTQNTCFVFVPGLAFDYLLLTHRLFCSNHKQPVLNRMRCAEATVADWQTFYKVFCTIIRQNYSFALLFHFVLCRLCIMLLLLVSFAKRRQNPLTSLRRCSSCL